MKKHTRIGLMVLVTVILLLALTFPGMAKKGGNSFELEFDLNTVDWINYTYLGTFESEGAIVDDGVAYGHWIPIWGVGRGTMIFESATGGDRIVISYNAPYNPAEGSCVNGNFKIYNDQNTGDYEGMWGEGKIEICRDNMGTTEDLNDDTMYGSLLGFAMYP